MVLDFISWMDGKSTIKCSSKEERREVFDFLKSVGYEMGFPEGKYDDEPWLYVFLSGGFIHMGGLAGKKDVKTFQEALDLYYANDEEIPDVDCLPDVSELLCP